MAKRTKKEQHGVNFFIPMVDLMVSAIFIFIIIVMILVLLIKVPTESTEPAKTPRASAAKGSETPVNPSIVENVIANKTSVEILIEDINIGLLKEQGINSMFDVKNNTLEIKLIKPKKIKEK